MGNEKCFFKEITLPHIYCCYILDYFSFSLSGIQNYRVKIKNSQTWFSVSYHKVFLIVENIIVNSQGLSFGHFPVSHYCR